MDQPFFAEDLFAFTDPEERRAQARAMFTLLFGAGEAYAVGGEDADPNVLADDLDADLVTHAHAPEPIAVYHANDGRAVLVAHVEEPGGLWAVDILPRLEDALWIDQEFEALQQTTDREETLTDESEWIGDEP